MMSNTRFLPVNRGLSPVSPLTLLRLKFGTISEAVETRIDQADAETLLHWSGRVLSAADIEDVVGDDG